MSDLEASLRTRCGNNLDFIRFFAATLVIGAHSFALRGDPHEPLSNWTHDQTMGHLGVSIFFFVSGLLITRSWLQEPSARSFLIRRVGRILPGLLVATLFCVFVVGPLATTWPLGRYFSCPGTYVFLFNALALPPHYFLPGTFNGNFSHAVNGSLWTLPVEVICYLVVLMIGCMRLLSARRFPLALIGLLMMLLRPYFFHLFVMGDGATGAHMHLLPNDRLIFDFLLGAAACVYREKIILRGEIALGIFVLILVTIFAPAGYYLRLFGVPYLTLYAIQAKTLWLWRWGKHGDFSYGLYIYAFPIQQLIVHYLGRDISGWLFFALSLALTLGLAAVSWHWVERPALLLIRRLCPHGTKSLVDSRNVDLRGTRDVTVNLTPARGTLDGTCPALHAAPSAASRV